MAEHDALGEPGGPARVPEPGQRVGAATDVVDRRAGCGHHVPRHRAVGGVGVPGVDRRPQPGPPRAQRRQHRHERVVHDEHRGVRVLQRVPDLLGRPAHVDRVDHGTGPPGREVVLQEAVRVQAQVGHPVALADAECAQRSGQSRDPLGELGERAGPVPRDGRREVRVLLDGTVQGLGQVHRSMVTGVTSRWCRRSSAAPDAGGNYHRLTTSRSASRAAVVSSDPSSTVHGLSHDAAASSR